MIEQVKEAAEEFWAILVCSCEGNIGNRRYWWGTWCNPQPYAAAFHDAAELRRGGVPVKLVPWAVRLRYVGWAYSPDPDRLYHALG
jgi:hypothetical protein